MILERRSGKSRLYAVITVAVSVFLLFIDWWTKRIVLSDLKPIGSFVVIPGLLQFDYAENTGIAFGLLKDQSWFVAGVTIISVIVILVLLFVYKRHSFFSYSAAALVLAGAVGNLIDRLVYGFVVDFIHVMFFDYIFNFADCCITVSAVLFIIHVLFFTKDEKKDDQDSENLS